MSTFIYTITVVVEADSPTEAWDEYIDLLSQPRFVKDGTEVTIEEGS